MENERINADIAVDQTVRLIDDLIKESENLKETLYTAFDFNNPRRWVEIFRSAEAELSPIQAKLKSICEKIDDQYIP